MKKILSFLFLSIFLFVSCESSTIGDYKKEALPKNFNFQILKDESNLTLEKNQLYVLINQKLTEGQIATLAEQLFSTKEQQRRFYIFYQLSEKDMYVWATSHFDPELKIEIIGSTSEEDNNVELNSNEEIDGVLIGKWKEEQYTNAAYIIYTKENDVLLKVIYPNGQSLIEPLLKGASTKGEKYTYKNGGYNNEYFVINMKKELEFYNAENSIFTTAYRKD